MSDLELTDEERNAIDNLRWPYARSQPAKIILPAIDKLKGARLKAEFWLEHNESPDIDGNRTCDICYWEEPGETFEPGGRYKERLDPRHDYTDEQWIEAGKK